MLTQVKKTVYRGLETHLCLFISIVLFRIALEVGYLYFVNPLYTYSGFTNEFNALKYLESWAILSFLILLARPNILKPSDFFMLLLLSGFIVPLLSLYALADHERIHLYIVLIGYLILEFTRRGREIKIPSLKEGPFIGGAILASGFLGVSAWFYWSGGLNFLNFDFGKVYDLRREVGDVIDVGIMGYINTWAIKVFGPALLALALHKRAFVLALLIVLTHLLWYGITTHKSVVFYPFLIIAVWLWLRRTNAASLMPVAITCIVLASLLFYFLFDELRPASLFIRRAFYVIANNVFDYYEFFSQNDFVLWSNSLTSSFINYPYSLNPPELIGVWRGTDNHVNNSFLSIGYMHAGAAGIILYASIVGLLFRLIDNLAGRGTENWAAIAILIIPVRTLLIGADLPPALLTHGILLAILILFLMRPSFRSPPKYAYVKCTPSGRD